MIDQKMKEYVQHVIRRNAKKVYELLHDLLGVVYVCGYVQPITMEDRS